MIEYRVIVLPKSFGSMREQLVKAVSLGHQVDDEVLLQFVTEKGDEPLSC